MSLEAMKNLVGSMVKPLRNRVYTMITRGILESANDSDGMQLVKLSLLAGEDRDKVERFQNFGFSSNPPVNSECVALAIGGNRDHLIVLAADNRASRITGLASGESVQYNTNGNKAHLKNTGEYEILLDTLKVENSTAELVDLLVKTLEALEIEPFIINTATITDLRTKMESFRV